MAVLIIYMSSGYGVINSKKRKSTPLELRYDALEL
jgi:hypothetical protein